MATQIKGENQAQAASITPDRIKPSTTDGDVLQTSGGATVWGAGAGGGGSNHNLLSSMHPDTVTGTPVQGDLVVADSTPKWARKAKGTDGKVLKMVAGTPDWADETTGESHNLLSAKHPDTVPAAPVAGDVMYADATPAWKRLPRGADGKFLKLVSGLPAWADASGGGGGGAGDSTFKAGYSGRPSPANDGDLFFPSDGFLVDRDTGSVWEPWGPLFPLSRPNNADFAWVNQGSATIVEEKGGIFLENIVSDNNTLRIRKKAAPSTPFTVTAVFIPMMIVQATQWYGLLWRESSSGKIVTYEVSLSAGSLRVTKWNDATVQPGTPNYVNQTGLTTILPGGIGLLYLRLEDDGTDRKALVSMDGQHFVQLHSVSRTDFLTADEVGFFVASNNGNFKMGVNLIHWKEA